MIDLDQNAVLALTALVITTIGLTYIGTSASRGYRDGGARIWGLGFLLQIVGVLAVIVVDFLDSPDWMGAWGHGLAIALSVAAAGCALLGFRSYNGDEVPGPALMVTALAFLAGAATIIEKPLFGVYGGSLWYSLAIAGISAGAVVHALSPRTRRHVMAWVFAGATTVATLFYVARASAALILGVDSPAFAQWFGAIPICLVLLTTGTVAWIAQFVLRGVLSSLIAGAVSATDDVLAPSTFLAVLHGILRRAAPRTEFVVVIAVIVEDVGSITASFGQEVADTTTRVLRSAVREFASPVAAVGESDDRTIILVATTASSPADARRQAGLLYRGVIESFVSARGIVVPGVGVGVATTQTLGYGPEVLVEAATIAAVEASESDETSVVFASVRSLPVDPFPAEPS